MGVQKPIQAHMHTHKNKKIKRKICFKLIFLKKENAQRGENQDIYFAAMFVLTQEQRQSAHQQEKTKHMVVCVENRSYELSWQDGPTMLALRRLKQGEGPCCSRPAWANIGFQVRQGYLCDLM